MVANLYASPATRSHQGMVSLAALGFLGLGIAALVAVGPWTIRTHGYSGYVLLSMASGMMTIAATLLAPAVPVRAGLLVVLGLALAMRLLIIADEPFLSTDIYRYVWDGRVQAAGINPYAYVPADEALAALRDAAIFPNINRADYATTAYPPVAQAFFLAATRLAESLTAMRLAMMACEIVVVVIMIDLLRRLQLPVVAVVAWAWHPLVVWEIANNGHVDALMIALLMAGTWLLVRSRKVAGAVAVALAALVKPYAVVILPAFWRPWDWRAPLAVIATLALCYLPYLGAGSGVLGFVTASGYLSEEGFTGGDGFWLVALVRAIVGDGAGLTAGYLLVSAAVLSWLALRTVMRSDPTTRDRLEDIAVLLMAGLFFLSPNYPWYFLAIVPFVVLGGGAPAWAMSLAAVLLYSPLTLPHNALAWETLSSLPFVITVAAHLLRDRLVPRIQRALPWTT